MGEWLPEPIGEAFSEIEKSIENKDVLSLVYLKLMEVLSPNERAVFLLKEGFHLSYSEIASLIDTNEVNCRKLFSRAKKKVTMEKAPQFKVKENRRVIEEFIQAFELGEMEKVLQYVGPDVTLYSDGGGVVKAAIRPILARDRVLLFLQGIYAKRPETIEFEIEMVNGQPSIVSRVDGRVLQVISFHFSSHQIQGIYIMLNPAKLKHID
ncbi:hypothetical protein GCM10008967_03180 [Bacillus carboniphilus]|uniref:RNA polymerase sigma factor 70 region 4 type 2 domain-containing protein n=2 Tax=Bacillus carboniphilus TaxID=86663 RepID=A0ABP3FEE1_9BACI